MRKILSNYFDQLFSFFLGFLVFNGKLGVLSKIRARMDFWQEWVNVKNYCGEKGKSFSVARQVAKTISDPSQVPNALISAIADDSTVDFKGVSLEFVSSHALWRLVHEILIDEEYFFPTSKKQPLILDCGTNFGMAIYYFKSLYPNCRVIGFEPVTYLRETAIRNITAACYKDVEVLPIALSPTKREATFKVSKNYPMAGSLTDRRVSFGDEVEEITVNCRPLSDFLNEEVAFLKIDIEGSEVEVLRECKTKLSCVQYLVCEYHHGAGNTESELVELLDILDKAGFVFHISKSESFSATMAKRPVMHADKPHSLLIYGKNRNLTPNSFTNPAS